MLVRDHYEKYAQFVKVSLMDEEEKNFFFTLREYYDEYRDVDTVDIDQFFVYFTQVKYDSLPETVLACYKMLFKKVGQARNTSAKSLIKKFQKHQYNGQMKYYLEHDVSVEKISQLTENYVLQQSVLDNPETMHMSNTISDIWNPDVVQGLYEWRTEFMNNSLGKLLPGTFGVIYSFPDAGKTSFLASELSYMARQLKGTQCILWLNNEQDERRIQQRIWTSVLERKPRTIYKMKNKNPELVEDVYQKELGGYVDRFKVVNIRGKRLFEIKKIVKTYRPSIVVVDQVDRVSYSKKQQKVDALEDLYQDMRDVAVESQAAIIGVCQAGGKEKQWLDLSDMYYSNTGKQGAVDWALGIGLDKDVPGERYFLLTKSKQGAKGQRGVVGVDLERALYDEKRVRQVINE